MGLHHRIQALLKKLNKESDATSFFIFIFIDNSIVENNGEWSFEH